MSAVLFASAALLLGLCAQQPVATQELQPMADSNTCLPELPTGSIQPKSSAPAVPLQLHNRVRLESLIDPDRTPRAEQNHPKRWLVRPGETFHQTLSLIALRGNRSIQVSIVTDGISLCMSSLTLYMNISVNGMSKTSTACSNVCFTNIASSGSNMNLPLLVLNNETNLQRSTEYLAVDGLDPESRTSYWCLGNLFSYPLSYVPRLQYIFPVVHCNTCMIAFNGARFHAGCSDTFRYGYCVSFSNLTECDFTGNRFCPICCQGEHCNKEIAEQLYRAADCSSSASSKCVLLTTFISLVLLWTNS